MFRMRKIKVEDKNFRKLERAFIHAETLAQEEQREVTIHYQHTSDVQSCWWDGFTVVKPAVVA